MKKIGMIGLGAMGHSVAENILSHGYKMVLFDIRPEACTDLLEKGAEGAASTRELGQKADIVLMMVNTYQHCVSAMTGLLETLRGGIIVNLGTIAMEEAQSIAQMAAKADCQMLDCPVSGGTAGAKAGTLTLMVAGSDEAFDTCKPVLDTFSANVVRVGEQPGQGQAVKAINQLLVGVHMCATAEAFTLARKCGLDLQKMYDTICTSAGTSRIFENRGQFLIDRNFNTRSTLQIQLKDTGIVCKTADNVGAHTPLANLAKEMFKLAVNKYPPTDDSLEVVRLYEEMSNIEI
jgi:3-hydroxyisobutyrate dehydrogenase-like beta-hydroxyacid dehydrogenase